MAILKLPEKLLRQMQLRGLNQQRLARAAGVSDSEVSRIVTGKSSPGLENAHRLARAVGVSLDYLADDTLADDPTPAGEELGEAERELLDLARAVGAGRAARILENVRIMGYESAMRRLLLEAKPVIEVGEGSPRPPAQAQNHGRASIG